MAAENKRIIVIGIDNSEFAEKSFDSILIPTKFMGGVRTVIMAGETPDFAILIPTTFMGGVRTVIMAGETPDFGYADHIRKSSDEIILVHCPETYDFTMASPAVVKQLLEELEKSVKTLEDKYRTKAKAKNIDGKFRTGQGKPGELLISVAKEENATMIITGSRGLGKIRRTILGSVSDYVIHHSHIPVLVCKA